MEVKYGVQAGDFANAGKVSSQVKQILKQLTLPPPYIKRIVVALYEAEVNVVAHSLGGEVECDIGADSVVIKVSDKGPGIDNLELAMSEGWSTASDKVREMGFGAGMGLSNIRKNCDELTIKTAKESPTHITMVFTLRRGER